MAIFGSENFVVLQTTEMIIADLLTHFTIKKSKKNNKKKTQKSLLCQKKNKTGMAIDASFFSFASGRLRHGSVATAQMTPAVDEMVTKTEVRVSSGEAYTYYII